MPYYDLRFAVCSSTENIISALHLKSGVQRGSDFRCLNCSNPVHFVNAQKRCAHFRHRCGESCVQNYNDLIQTQFECDSHLKNKSEGRVFHSAWQNLFLSPFVEKIVRVRDRVRIADVLVPLDKTDGQDNRPDWMKNDAKHLVLEIQHSPLPKDIAIGRHCHYHSNGSQLAWIIDLTHIDHVLEHTIHLHDELIRFIFTGSQHGALVNILQAYEDDSIPDQPCIFLDRGDENLYHIHRIPHLNTKYTSVKPIPKRQFLSDIERHCTRGCLADNHTDIVIRDEKRLTYFNHYASSIRQLSSERDAHLLNGLSLLMENTPLYEMHWFAEAMSEILSSIPHMRNRFPSLDVIGLVRLFVEHLLPASSPARIPFINNFQLWAQKTHHRLQLIVPHHDVREFRDNSTVLDGDANKYVSTIFRLMCKTFGGEGVFEQQSQDIENLTVLECNVMRRFPWIAEKVLGGSSGLSASNFHRLHIPHSTGVDLSCETVRNAKNELARLQREKIQKEIETLSRIRELERKKAEEEEERHINDRKKRENERIERLKKQEERQKEIDEAYDKTIEEARKTYNANLQKMYDDRKAKEEKKKEKAKLQYERIRAMRECQQPLLTRAERENAVHAVQKEKAAPAPAPAAIIAGDHY